MPCATHSFNTGRRAGSDDVIKLMCGRCDWFAVEPQSTSMKLLDDAEFDGRLNTWIGAADPKPALPAGVHYVGEAP